LLKLVVTFHQHVIGALTVTEVYDEADEAEGPKTAGSVLLPHVQRSFLPWSDLAAAAVGSAAAVGAPVRERVKVLFF